MLVKEIDEKNKSALIYKPTQKTLDLLPMIFALMRWGIAYNKNSDTSGPVMKEFMERPEELQKKIIEKFQQ